jgi:4'-phosphopantetheinyl transferase
MRSPVHDALEVVTISLDAAFDTVRAAAVLSRDERRRADRFARERDRRRFIVSRAQLRELLGARLRVPPEHVEFVYGPAGKPALATRFGGTGLRFNVSHCDGIAAFAFTIGRDIGIDIEAVRALPDADAVASLVFSPEEQATYRALEVRDRPLGFFNCWTRKEAFVKAIGDGLRYPLDRFEVSLTPGEPPRLLRIDSTPGSRTGWRLHAFVPAPGLIGAVAVRTRTYGSGMTMRPRFVVHAPSGADAGTTVPPGDD